MDYAGHCRGRANPRELAMMKAVQGYFRITMAKLIRIVTVYWVDCTARKITSAKECKRDYDCEKMP